MKKYAKKVLMLLVIFILSVFLCAYSSPVSTKKATSKNTGTITVHAKVPTDWKNVACWAWEDGGEDAFVAWPGKSMFPSSDGWYTTTVPNWIDCIIINGNAGSVQTADLFVKKGADLWIQVTSPNYVSISYTDPGDKQQSEKTETSSTGVLAGDVVQVAVSKELVVVLRSDGTVRVDGASYSVRSKVNKWKDVTKVWADSYAIFGLTKDGNVLSTKGSYSGWSKVKDLFLYRSVYADPGTAPDVFAVKTDGTVTVSSASGDYSSRDFSSWKNIESIYVSEYPACVMGLTADDSLMLYRNGKSNKMLTDVKSVYQDSYGYVFIIKENGRVQGLQADTDGTIYFLDWKLQNIDSVTVRLPDTLYAVTKDGDLISSCAGIPWENYYHEKGALDDFTNIISLGTGRYDSIIALREDGSTVCYPQDAYGNLGSLRGITAMKEYQGVLLAASAKDGSLLLTGWEDYFVYEIGSVADFWFAADQAVICLRTDGTIVKVPVPDWSAPDYETTELTHLTANVKH